MTLSGVTPFSAILADLEENFQSQGDPWKLTRTRSWGRQRTLARRASSASTRVNSGHSQLEKRDDEDEAKESLEKQLGVQYFRRNKAGEHAKRRVDFHWSVREKNDLLVRCHTSPSALRHVFTLY